MEMKTSCSLWSRLRRVIRLVVLVDINVGRQALKLESRCTELGRKAFTGDRIENQFIEIRAQEDSIKFICGSGSHIFACPS